MFKITSDYDNELGRGFQMTFENEYTISVQFGRGTYSDNRSLVRNFANLYSRDAEVMVWDKDKNPIAIENYTGDDGIGPHLYPDAVARLMDIVANL